MKDSIRRRILKKRHKFLLPEQRAADKFIFQKLINSEQWRNSLTVCIYRAFPHEVETKNILAQKKTFVVLEQTPSLQFPDISMVDLFIVPGVAFDREGYRLGWGKGYYDRLLASVKATKIGLAYSFQIVPRLPRTGYDIPMDIVITEHETLTP